MLRLCYGTLLLDCYKNCFASHPFNPSTVIRFNSEMQQQVSLQIFDILGQRVATLVDGIRQARSYEVRLDPADLSSGVYFYRLQGGNQQLTRKMTLTK